MVVEQLGGGSSKCEAQLFKAVEGRGSRATNYNAAKEASKCVVHQTRSEAEKFALQKIYLRSADIYSLAQQMQRDNQERNQLRTMHANWR